MPGGALRSARTLPASRRYGQTQAEPELAAWWQQAQAERPYAAAAPEADASLGVPEIGDEEPELELRSTLVGDLPHSPALSAFKIILLYCLLPLASK